MKKESPREREGERVRDAINRARPSAAYRYMKMKETGVRASRDRGSSLVAEEKPTRRKEKERERPRERKMEKERRFDRCPVDQNVMHANEA